MTVVTKIEDFGKEFDLENQEDLKELNKLMDERLRHVSVFAIEHPQYFTENGLNMAREYLENDK